MFATLLEILLVYLIVQTTIILFIAPFYLLYRKKQVPADGPKVGFSQHLEQFFASKYANWLVFFWAAGEAVVWFVVPEFLLLLVVFMRIRSKRQLLFYDIYGTAAGTLVAMVMHLSHAQIIGLPFIKPEMLTHVQRWFDEWGIFGLLHQPFSGVPYKVFTHMAADYQFFLPAFIIFAVIVRISRYWIGYVIFSSLYPVLHRFVYRNYLPLFFIATAIFSVLLYRVYSSFA
jgi:membrane protein YqaA with SNARE-associated domain